MRAAFWAASKAKHMYPGDYVNQVPDRPAIIMADTGETVSYAEYEVRTNQLAHYLRDQGLNFRDHYSIFMENNVRYIECCGAGERAGLYYTSINSYLGPEELAYILNNSESKLLITSAEKLPVVVAAIDNAPAVARVLVVGSAGEPAEQKSERFLNFESTVSAYPGTPIEDELLGTSMLYSSGTTGRPKGVSRPLKRVHPREPVQLYTFIERLWQFREHMTYLSPAPLYHSAPQGAVCVAIRLGGTVIVMNKFDPERYLELVAQYRVTHSQLVPTMFSRMLKLPERIRQEAE